MKVSTTVILPTGVTVDPESLIRCDDTPVTLVGKILNASVAPAGTQVSIQIVIDGIEPHLEFRQNERKDGKGNNHLVVALKPIEPETGR